MKKYSIRSNEKKNFPLNGIQFNEHQWRAQNISLESVLYFFLDILRKSELVATHRLGNVNQKETIHEYKFKSKPNMNHDMRVRFLI